MFKIQGKFNGKWEPMFVMRTLMGSLEYIKAGGYDLSEVVDGSWYYIRNGAYREPMYEAAFGEYSEVRIVPIVLDFLDTSIEYEVIVADCVNIVSEIIPSGYLRKLLFEKIAKLSIKDIEFMFGDVTKLVFDFTDYEVSWIRETYPEYEEFLLGGTIPEKVLNDKEEY